MANEIRVVRWGNNPALTQEEAEAHLHKEGYPSFQWYDVPGAVYPRHKHEYDECIWVLKGEIQFTIEGETYSLKAGDKIYLPASVLHKTVIPSTTSVTYLVGQKTG